MIFVVLFRKYIYWASFSTVTEAFSYTLPFYEQFIIILVCIIDTRFKVVSGQRLLIALLLQEESLDSVYIRRTEIEITIQADQENVIVDVTTFYFDCYFLKARDRRRGLRSCGQWVMPISHLSDRSYQTDAFC
jgi:hypothetical protein